MVMIHAVAKNEGQRLLGSKVTVETNKLADGADCITFLTMAVSNDDRPTL